MGARSGTAPGPHKKTQKKNDFRRKLVRKEKEIWPAKISFFFSSTQIPYEFIARGIQKLARERKENPWPGVNS